MKVKLSQIKVSTTRVRKELNLDRLDELAESIQEAGGVIVPVKLRMNGGLKEIAKAASGGDVEYTTIYGHRRIEACRMAGVEEIEAFIEDVDDDVLLTQALIENVVREDMLPLDVARALKQVKLENEWTNEQVGAKFGMDESTVSRYLAMPQSAARQVFESNPEITHKHLAEAKRGTDDEADVVKVLEKVAEEGLSQRQTRTIAEEYTKAKEFGGAKRAKAQVLDPKYEEIVFSEGPPKPKPKPIRKPPVASPRWSWVQNPNVEKMYSAIQVFGPMLEYMRVNRAEEPADLVAVLKQVRAYLSTTITKIDALLKDIGSV